MIKRIYLSFLCLVLLCAIALSASVSIIVYNATRNREIASIKDRANLAADLINNSDNLTGFSDFANYDADAARVTIIAYDGTVLLDNKAVAASLENHGDRQEFLQAMQTGRGESMRYSATLNSETYYYAIRLNNGNVLRVSKTMDRIVGVFINVLLAIVGVTVLVLIIASFLAHRLAKRIIDPLNRIDFEGDKSNVYDELLPFVKKLEQQKKEIDEQVIMLKNRADTIDAITGNMKEGLILLDKTGVVMAINKSATDIFREKDMPGRSILHTERDLEFQGKVKECLSGINAGMILHRDDKTYNAYFSPVQDYEISGGIILFQDISESYEAEKQRREFSANVSHELKTPLTTISATAEMIENGMAQEDDIKAFAGKITTQAKRLINVIEDIIKLSEFDEGTMVAEHTEFEMYELAESVIDVLRQKADEKNVSVDLIGNRFLVNANRQMIDELLFNLIDNAITYNKDNGSVTVTLSKENGTCKITVSDTGIGISGEHQSRVFERFYRADKSRSKKTGGTGLGLSIVKHVAEYHGGKVALTSTVDVGTTVECLFRITL